MASHAPADSSRAHAESEGSEQDGSHNSAGHGSARSGRAVREHFSLFVIAFRFFVLFLAQLTVDACLLPIYSAHEVRYLRLFW